MSPRARIFTYPHRARMLSSFYAILDKAGCRTSMFDRYIYPKPWAHEHKSLHTFIMHWYPAVSIRFLDIAICEALMLINRKRLENLSKISRDPTSRNRYIPPLYTDVLRFLCLVWRLGLCALACQFRLWVKRGGFPIKLVCISTQRSSLSVSTHFVIHCITSQISIFLPR